MQPRSVPTPSAGRIPTWRAGGVRGTAGSAVGAHVRIRRPLQHPIPRLFHHPPDPPPRAPGVATPTLAPQHERAFQGSDQDRHISLSYAGIGWHTNGNADVANAATAQGPGATPHRTRRNTTHRRPDGPLEGESAMTIPVHADDQLWSVDDVSTYLTVPAATLLRRTTRRRRPAPAWPDRVCWRSGSSRTRVARRRRSGRRSPVGGDDIAARVRGSWTRL
jgi:hypothetical protein